MGDESAGEESTASSTSEPETSPASSEAAKLLEISGSDTNAYEDWVEVAESVEVVRSRCERRDVRGSSCQTDAEVLALPYSFPCSSR